MKLKNYDNKENGKGTGKGRAKGGTGGYFPDEVHQNTVFFNTSVIGGKGANKQQ